MLGAAALVGLSAVASRLHSVRQPIAPQYPAPAEKTNTSRQTLERPLEEEKGVKRTRPREKRDHLIIPEKVESTRFLHDNWNDIKQFLRTWNDPTLSTKVYSQKWSGNVNEIEYSSLPLSAGNIVAVERGKGNQRQRTYFLFNGRDRYTGPMSFAYPEMDSQGYAIDYPFLNVQTFEAILQKWNASVVAIYAAEK